MPARATPRQSKIAVADHNGEERRVHDGGAAGGDEGDIGKETGGKAEQRRYSSPAAIAPALASRADEPQGANQKIPLCKM